MPEAFAPRQVIQMDTVDFGAVFAFTAVDIFSKEADVLLAPELTSEHGHRFLQVCMAQISARLCGFGADGRRAGVQGELCTSDKRLLRPTPDCPTLQEERTEFYREFNRTVRNECLGWSKYKPSDIPELTHEVTAFLQRYLFHRPHLGLSPLRPPL